MLWKHWPVGRAYSLCSRSYTDHWLWPLSQAQQRKGNQHRRNLSGPWKTFACSKMPHCFLHTHVNLLFLSHPSFSCRFKIVNAFLVILLLMNVHVKRFNYRNKQLAYPVISFCSNIWVLPLHMIAFYLMGRCLFLNIPFTSVLPTEQSLKDEGA